MPRDTGKKMKATYGYCEQCEKFYPTGEYVLKHELILCVKHMEEYEVVKQIEEEKNKRMYSNE